MQAQCGGADAAMRNGRRAMLAPPLPRYDEALIHAMIGYDPIFHAVVGK
jgi:hypothetical protein